MKKVYEGPGTLTHEGTKFKSGEPKEVPEGMSPCKYLKEVVEVKKPKGVKKDGMVITPKDGD